MTPQELKNSILQLAIQGKLVEQRPEEGTAEELFREIQKEKQALIKAGKIKKEKPLPEITEELPFDIPETWKWVRLGNIGSWCAGATPPRTNAEYYNGNIPWLKTGDLNDGYVSEVPESISALALEKTSVRLNPVGSVLMAMYGATIGKLAILSVPMTTNQACCACIPYGEMFNKYLFYYLLGMRKAFIKMGEGGAQPNISKDKIVNSLIPLPPLAEQKRIVAKIEELLPLIDRYEKAWTRLEEFNKRFPGDMQKSILQMAIQGKLVEQRPEEGTGEELYQQIQKEKQALIREGKINIENLQPEIAEDELSFDIPETWKWVRVENIAILHNGRAYKQNELLERGKYPVLRVGNLFTSSKWYYSDLELEKEKYCDNGDLLYSWSASFGPHIWDGEKVIYHYHIWKIEFTKYVDKEYFYYFLLADTDSIKRSGHGLAMIHVTKAGTEKRLFPLPPLAEQKRIVARLKNLLPLCARLK